MAVLTRWVDSRMLAGVRQLGCASGSALCELIAKASEEGGMLFVGLFMGWDLFDSAF